MNTISFNRIKCLFIEYFALHWKRDLMIFGGLFVAEMGSMYLHFPFHSPDFILFVMSIVLCGITFNFLSKKTLGMSYLLCPANTAEKVIVNILLLHVYFTAMIFLTCILARYMMQLFYYPQTFIMFMFGQVEELITFPMFWVSLFVTQSFVLFTSIYFRKNALLKAVLSLAVLFTVLGLIVKFTGIGHIVMRVDNHYPISMTYNGLNCVDILTYIFEVKYKFIYHRALWFIAPVFFWVLSYFRLKETEV